MLGLMVKVLLLNLKINNLYIILKNVFNVIFCIELGFIAY
jgi:hypothetical protein